MEFKRIPHSSDVFVEIDIFLVGEHAGGVVKIIALVSVAGSFVILIVVSEKKKNVYGSISFNMDTVMGMIDLHPM